MKERLSTKKTIEEYVLGTDWRIKANSNTGYSNAGLVNQSAGKVIANYWLDEIYSSEEGEATTFKEIKSLCEKIKQKGFKIKLDTNGTNPKIIEDLIKNDLINYISLDIKAASKEKFNEITNLHKSILIDSLYKTINVLNKYKFNYECRTTIHSDFFKIDDIIECIDLVYDKGYRNKYALQLALDDVKTLNNLTNTKKNIIKKT